jgi:hypothetical protein
MPLVVESAAWDCHRRLPTVEEAASDSHPPQTFPQEFARHRNYLYYSYPRLLPELKSMQPGQTAQTLRLFFSRVTLHGVTMKHDRTNRVLVCKSFYF